MKKFALLLAILTFSGSIFSQKAPTLAPLNPNFVRFLAKSKNGEYPKPGTDAFGTGGVPPPCQVNFDDYFKNNKPKSVNFDPVYDMRTTGLLTPVKGQTGNACWAFASIASVESQWLVLGLGSWDLSENNLKYCHDFDPSRNTWGNHFMSTAYFTRRKGPLLEADDPNAESSLCPGGKTPVGYISDARYLPKDMVAVKQAILDHGAIYTMMYIDGAYYNAANYTYYYSGPFEINHAVDLVGWDDTKVTAGGTGAWICKNSYGTGWGEAGYFYISYNDNSILEYNAYWPTRMDNVPESTIYGYDDLGNYESAGYEGPIGYMLVKFVCTGKQLLSKIGTYAMATNTTMEIDIFDNFDPVTLVPSGLIMSLTGLSCPMPGYYTFDLPSAITMEEGNDFYIRVRYQTPSFNYPIPYECYISGYSDPVIESNVAWISEDAADGSWYLIGNTTSLQKWDPCIKVYAEPYPVSLTWDGSNSSDWNNAENWTPAYIPDGSKDVIIPAVLPNPIVNQALATPAVCKNLAIDEGSSLLVNTDNALTVYGNLTNNAGNTGLILESGASLLTKGAVSGQATVNRNISGAKWHLISSPVAGAVSGMFQGKFLQQFNETGNSFTDVTSITEPLTPAKGFALWGGSSGFPVQYVGALNSGSKAASLSRTATGGNSGWNLVGNPYPSTIDWDASGWTKTNLNNAIYIENDGGWATYISGAGTNGGSKFIASNQGFFVSVDAPGTATLAMNNFVRVHNATTFFKNTNSGSFVRIEVSGNGYSDEAIVRFMPQATNEFDGEYDALKLFGFIDESAQIYTLGSTPLTINTLFPETKEVALGIQTGTSGEYTIAATEINTLGNFILEDTKTGILTKLAEKSYAFTFEAGENELRFKLHFSALSVKDLGDNIAEIYSYLKTVYINTKGQHVADIFIYTANGQLVTTKSSISGMTMVSLNEPGIYIVKLSTKDEIVVRKVWIQ